MCVFTADEAWDYLKAKPQDVDSVHLSTLAQPLAASPQNAAFALVMSLRENGLLQLDELKKANKAAGVDKNKSTDAEAIYTTPTQADADALAAFGVDLEDLVGCGYQSIVVDPTAAETSIQIADRRDDYAACARSYKRRPDVGSDAEFPDLSARDAGRGPGERRVIALAVLVSGSGSTLQNLIDCIAAKRLDARVAIVIGSRDELGAKPRAAKAGLRYDVVARREFDSPDAFSEQIFETCDEAGVDLVCCAGWLALLRIPTRYEHRVINVHPSLLPAFGGKGMYGRRVHQAVLDHGCKLSGCTVHFLDDRYDGGPIIAQRTCEVRDDDTAESLATRVQAEERLAFPEAIAAIARGGIVVDGRRVRRRG